MRAKTIPRWTTGVLFVLLLCNNCVSQDLTSKSRQVVHSIERFYALSEEEAKEGRPVRIEGVVLYSDPAWGLLWVTDETGRLYQQISSNELLVRPGASVLISGKTSYAGNCPTIKELSVSQLGSGVLPPPKVLMPHELKAPQTTRGLVSLSGSVVSARYNDDQHIILVVAFLRRYFVRVTINQCQKSDLEGLLGARVEVVGVASDVPDKLDDRIIDTQVFVPSLDQVTVFQRGRPDLFQSREISIESVPKEFRQIRDPQFVKIRGSVVDRPSQDTVVIDDGDASIPVRMQTVVSLEHGATVEAVGIVFELRDQPKDSNRNLILDRASVRLAAESRSAKPSSETAIRSVSALRSLSREEAALERSVEITGVVTYYDPVWRVLFIHDGRLGVYVDDKKQSRSLRLGDKITVKGISDPGGFAPMVVAEDIQKQRKSGELPVSTLNPLSDLNNSSMDSQWMSIVGTVKSVERSQKNLVLSMSNAEREFDAVVCGAGNLLKKKNWVGSQLNLTGVCGIKSNANSQPAGVYFHVPGEAQIEFLRESPSDPFSVPTIPISEAIAQSPSLGREFHSRLTGTVTYVDRTGLVAIQDESAGIFVRLKKLETPNVGDTIDIMGFASQRSALSIPRVSLWRRSNSGLEPPTAKEIELSKTNPKSFKSQLVSVQGTVLRNSVGAAIPGLTVQSDGFVFSIDLSSPTKEDAWTQLKEGSLIQVEGVMDIHADDLDRLESFRLLCPLSAKIHVIRAAPWWNAQHTSLLIGSLVVLIVGGLGWVGTLRSTVTRQTKRIESELHARGELAHRYNTIIDNASELIFSLKRSGEFISANPATERAFDAPNSMLLGQPLGEYLTAESGKVLQLLMTKLEDTYPHAIVELTTERGLVLETALQLSLSPSGEEV
ncbi:MAG: PAS domain-containing protein, partial [Planctomycetota bacterium]